MRLGGVLRIGGAIALLIGGLVHLDLYFGGYRDAGSVPTFGRSILLNAIVSGVLAVAVAARREWFVRAAGIALSAATLAAFTFTHTGHALFGFEGDGLQPSPQAEIVLIAAITSIVLLAASFVPAIADRDESSNLVAMEAGVAVVAIAYVGFGFYWANTNDTPAVAGGPASVTIADFTFTPEVVSVPVGSAVTWTNNDALGHSIVASDDSFSSETLDGGATFQFTFDAPGDHAYFCGIHPTMTGTVTVTD